MITKTLATVVRALLVIASCLAFALSFLVVADVVGRVVFNNPVQGTPELVSSSIVIICYLMAVYAILSGGMMEVTLITDSVPPRFRTLLGVLGCLLGALLFGLIAWGGYERFVQAWIAGSYEGEGALRVPTWPARFAVFIGSALATFAYLLLAVRGVMSGLRGEPFDGRILQSSDL